MSRASYTDKVLLAETLTNRALGRLLEYAEGQIDNAPVDKRADVVLIIADDAQLRLRRLDFHHGQERGRRTVVV